VQRLLLAAGNYIGRPVADVQAELSVFGLAVTLRPLTTTDVPDGTVIAVDPVGELTPGSPVTLTHAVAPPPAPAPETVVVTQTPEPTPEPEPAPETAGNWWDEESTDGDQDSSDKEQRKRDRRDGNGDN
jgi:serine/threonine-protein kinase